MMNDPHRPPASSDGTFWWIGTSREQFASEVAKRFAVNRANGQSAFHLKSDRAQQAAAARWRQRGLGSFPTKKTEQERRGSVLMPTSQTLRSEFVQQERFTVSDLRSAGLL